MILAGLAVVAGPAVGGLVGFCVGVRHCLLRVTALWRNRDHDHQGNLQKLLPQDLRGSRTVYYTGAVVTLHLVDGVVQHVEIGGVLDGLPDEIRDDDDPQATDPVACPVPLGDLVADAIQASLPAVVYRALNDGVTVFAGGGPRQGSEPFTVYAN